MIDTYISHHVFGAAYDDTKSMFITRDSEVIMLSPCVFVCLRVCVYVSHDSNIFHDN